MVNGMATGRPAPAACAKTTGEDARLNRRGLTPVERALADLAEAVPACAHEFEIKKKTLGAMAAAMGSLAYHCPVYLHFGTYMVRDLSLLMEDGGPLPSVSAVAPGVAPALMAA